VSAFQDMGIPGAANVMNAVVLTAVLSCLNSGLYTSSRMLFVLADQGQAPRRLLDVNRRGVPMAAILCSTIVGYLCVIAAYVSPDTVFLFLLNSSGAIILFVYLLICVSEIVMRRSIPPERLRVKMWFFPVLSLLTAAAMVLVLISMGLRSDTRSQLLLSLLAWAVVLVAYVLTRGRQRAVVVPAAAPAAAPATAAATADLGPISRVLVVANETVQADALLNELRELNAVHDAEYLVLVPASPVHSGQGAVWAPNTAVAAAEHRLTTTLGILRADGLHVDGEVGDYRPLHAMDQAVADFHPDIIVISTHPEERSVWLRQDIVGQARRRYHVPVRHVVSRVPVEIFGT